MTQRRARAGEGVNALGQLVRRLISWESLLLYVRDVSAADDPALAAHVPLEIRLATRAEVAVSGERLGQSEAQIETRLARGDRCFVALSEGRLVHTTWLSVKQAWIPDLGASLALASDEVYVGSSFTDPAFRRQGVHSAVRSLRRRYAREHGIKWEYAYVRRSNQAVKRFPDLLPRPASTWALRCVRVGGLRGRLVTGLGQPSLPKIEFPAGFTARPLGPLGHCVTPPPGRRWEWHSENPTLAL